MVMHAQRDPKKPEEWLVAARDINAVSVPSGYASVITEGTEVTVTQELGGDLTVRNRYYQMFRVDGPDAEALGLTVKDPLEGLDLSQGPSDDNIDAMLALCYDPEIPINIKELGLVYSVEKDETEPGTFNISVKMTLTAPGCGMGEVLTNDVRRKVSMLPGVTHVDVELVFDPPWDMAMMSEAARLSAGMLGQ